MKVQQGKHGRQRLVEWEGMPGGVGFKIKEGGTTYNAIFDNRDEAADFAYRILASLPAMYLPERSELVALPR